MAAVCKAVQPRTQSVTVATAPGAATAHVGVVRRSIVAMKLITLAIVVGIGFVGLARAQTADPNATAAPTTAPLGTEEQLRMRHRGFLPPGEQPEPTYQRVCAWRSDGGPVTTRMMRLPVGISIATCAVDQNQHLHTRCRCDRHRGYVIEVPV